MRQSFQCGSTSGRGIHECEGSKVGVLLGSKIKEEHLGACLVHIRSSNLDRVMELKIESEIGEIARTLIIYSFGCQNKDFEFYSGCNGKTVEGIQKKNDKISFVF